MPAPPCSRAAAALIGVALAATACTTAPEPAPTTAPTPSAVASTAATEPAGDGLFGAGCPNFPDTGAGSLVDLSDRDWVDALGQVPALSQLSVTTALSGLLSSVQNVQEATVFAPTDTAFRRLGAAEGRRLLADPSAAVDVLSYHVVPERLTPQTLAGSHRTVAGEDLRIEGSEPTFTINGEATITCGNIKVRNATLYLVDRVLQPT